LFCSLGIPFLNAGDERWRTQRGNNNAYCQDNETSWIDWNENADTRSMREFVRSLAEFRRTHPVLRRARHFDGRIDPVTGRADVAWLDALGAPMSHDVWHAPETTFFAALMQMSFGCDGEGADGSLLYLFNTSP